MGRGVKRVVGVKKGRERGRSREAGHEHMERGGEWNRERMEAGREEQSKTGAKDQEDNGVLNLIVYRKHDK